MAYTSYEFYKDVFDGEIVPEAEFGRVERDASNKLDTFTFGRITEVTERVQLAVCQMAELIYCERKRATNKDVASETNDGYSVTYVTSGLNDAARKELVEKELYSAAYAYLGRTGLMDWSC